MDNTQHLSDDERYGLAMMAAASERRNRPRNLVLIPMLLFIVSSLALAYALYSVESGRIRLRNQQLRYDRLITGVVDLQELMDAGAEEEGEQGLAPITDFLSRVEGYARDAGIDSSLGIPTTRRDRSSNGLVRVRQIYNGVTDSSLEDLMAWVKRTRDEIPGLFITSLTLKPAGNRGWTMDITFARWERGESS